MTTLTSRIGFINLTRYNCSSDSFFSSLSIVQATEELYSKDGSDETVLCAATMRWKLQFKFAIISRASQSYG